MDDTKPTSNFSHACHAATKGYRAFRETQTEILEISFEINGRFPGDPALGVLFVCKDSGKKSYRIPRLSDVMQRWTVEKNGSVVDYDPQEHAGGLISIEELMRIMAECGHLDCAAEQAEKQKE